jgi:hypothetical protein
MDLGPSSPPTCDAIPAIIYSIKELSNKEMDIISFVPSTGLLTYDPRSIADIGEYKFKIKAKIGSNKKETEFTLKVLAPCTLDIA